MRIRRSIGVQFSAQSLLAAGGFVAAVLLMLLFQAGSGAERVGLVAPYVVVLVLVPLWAFDLGPYSRSLWIGPNLWSAKNLTMYILKNVEKCILKRVRGGEKRKNIRFYNVCEDSAKF